MLLSVRVMRVLNSMAANRRLALTVVAAQALATVVLALAFLVLSGKPAALAAAMGGGALALGNLMMGWRSMRGAYPSAGFALAGLVAGIVLKWFVVIGALYLALARFGLPPLPLLAGMAGTLAATYFIHKFEA